MLLKYIHLFMVHRIYFISGLGADRRVFRKLVFPEHFELVYLDWISPVPNETLESYATRIATNIDTSAPFYLIGLSFGGMLATEIAKRLTPIQTFLISSIPVFKNLPWYYRMAGRASLQKMVTLSLIKTSNSVGLKFMGATTLEDRTLLKQLVKDSDARFIKWALTCILTWRNTERPTNLTHIHGTADNILPIKYTKPDAVIKGGGHFMVHSNATEIRKIIMDKMGDTAYANNRRP